MVAEICQTNRVPNDHEIDKLYQKVLIIITLLSGLGSPMDPPVLKEVAIALQSVYLPSELTHFVVMKKKEKENQLIELVKIVAGIRLFNRDCQKGGEGIDDCEYFLYHLGSQGKNKIIIFFFINNFSTEYFARSCC